MPQRMPLQTAQGHGQDIEFPNARLHSCRSVRPPPGPCGHSAPGVEVQPLAADAPPLPLRLPLALPESPCGVSRVPLLRFLVWLLSASGP